MEEESTLLSEVTMGPKDKPEEKEFENSGQAYKADLDAVYGEGSDPEAQEEQEEQEETGNG